jgi:hypothetical protein
MAYAESRYIQAALRDETSGSGWLRLARLQWLSERYSPAIATLIGPPPAADRSACRLPLAAAVRAANGTLAFDATARGWDGPGKAAVAVTRSGDTIVLTGAANGTTIGRCRISGLALADAALLETFFGKYQPDMLRSGDSTSFESWLRLVAVPSLGDYGAMAAALNDEARSALLATSIYLGAPPLLGRLPDSQAQPRPAYWMEHDVVTRIEW